MYSTYYYIHYLGARQDDTRDVPEAYIYIYV